MTLTNLLTVKIHFTYKTMTDNEIDMACTSTEEEDSGLESDGEIDGVQSEMTHLDATLHIS